MREGEPMDAFGVQSKMIRPSFSFLFSARVPCRN